MDDRKDQRPPDVNRRGLIGSVTRRGPTATAQIGPLITAGLWIAPMPRALAEHLPRRVMRRRGHLRRADERPSLRIVRNRSRTPTCGRPSRSGGDFPRAAVARGRDAARNFGRHAEMPEDPADHGRLLDERDQTQAAATPGTQHVKPEGARHQRSPALAASLAPRRLRWVGFTRLLSDRFLRFRLATIP
jgi:hypothetical protein